MPVRKAVLDHADGNPLPVEPVGHVCTLIERRYYLISATRANHDHLALAFLRDVEVYSGIVTDEADIAVLLHVLSGSNAVGLAGTKGYLNTVLDNAFVNRLTFRIKLQCAGRAELGLRLIRLCSICAEK